MLTRTYRKQKDTNQSAAHAISQKLSSAKTTSQFVDNRPEAIQMKGIQKIIHKSTIQQMKVIQRVVSAAEIVNFVSSGEFGKAVAAKEKETKKDRVAMRYAKITSGELNGVGWLDLNQIVEWVVPVGRQDLPSAVVNMYHLQQM